MENAYERNRCAFDGHMLFYEKGASHIENGSVHLGSGFLFGKQTIGMYRKTYWNKGLLCLLPTMEALWFSETTLGNRIFPQHGRIFTCARLYRV